MREVLFRAKEFYDNEWVEGFYVHANKYYGEDVDRHFIVEHGEFEYDNYAGYEVNPDTVGQYTGLTDNTKWEQLTKEEQSGWLKNHTVEEWNGKKIFEGDIVKAVIVRDLGGGTENREETGVVGYDKIGMIGLITKYDGAIPVWSDFFQELTLSGCIDDFWFEVIGNIHDNPELLEVDNG